MLRETPTTNTVEQRREMLIIFLSFIFSQKLFKTVLLEKPSFCDPSFFLAFRKTFDRIEGRSESDTTTATCEKGMRDRVGGT